ncbi:MAG TPA: 16S rRNA (cytosine(1402)-N(4))-methyltransferase RsmH [Casimicrobiaceae bacterium]|nr:16S rRNA (cytosine(1402)-N(4))-methyltransferase RsmH [Casimicrobiaceae bacterium]
MQQRLDGGHVPVLLAESLAGLALRDGGIYVDATFGRGGHARAMLDAIGAHGRVVAIDRDPAAEAAAGAIADARFTFHRGWFSELPEILASLGIRAVDGVLLDLGVSSPQLEDPARGFTFRVDGPLDMRMDPSRGETAAEFLAHASVDELTRVIRDYGEERFARSVARAIAKARDIGPIVSTRELAAIVAQAIGTRTRGDWRQDPAARTFQALRIAVNRELHEVSAALPRITTLLEGGGRLAAISFHSLEDRIVKRFLAFASKPFGGNAQLARMPIAEAALPAVPLRIVGRAIKPSASEIARNPRARSAVLRIAERTAAPLPALWPRGFDSEQG